MSSTTALKSAKETGRYSCNITQTFADTLLVSHQEKVTALSLLLLRKKSDTQAHRSFGPLSCSEKRTILTCKWKQKSINQWHRNRFDL